MFKTEFIGELISGQLSNEGYKHIISVVASYVKNYSWPKSIIVTSEINSTWLWSTEDVEELAHQFLEWSLTRGKFDHINKIPKNYLSYYFSQILISFVANRIKEEQQREGLSFEKCRELVMSICKNDYIINFFEGKEYVFINTFSKEEIKPFEEIANTLSYLSKIPIKETTKHFRPLVKLAIEDIFNSAEAPIQLNKLTETVYSLFDQKGFNYIELNEDTISEDDMGKNQLKFSRIIRNLLSGLSKDDARMISNFLFHNKEKQSLTYMANKYNVPKSTLHHKIDSFKKKISYNYTPENEQDGIYFIKNIANSLDKLAK